MRNLMINYSVVIIYRLSLSQIVLVMGCAPWQILLSIIALFLLHLQKPTFNCYCNIISCNTLLTNAEYR